MRKMALFLFSACALSWTSAAYAQDSSSSLGDVARQARQQKQQKDAEAAKEAQSSASPGDSVQANDLAEKGQSPKTAKRIVTNDEIPEHSEPYNTVESRQPNATLPQKSSNQIAAEQTKSQILRMKSYIATLQSRIANLEQSVRYCNGVVGCVQRNERQQQKQGQVEAMKQQLAQQQKSLEHMQEMARRQGYGSSIYDP